MKNKLTDYIIALAIFCLLTIHAYAQGNLIINGSFENGGGSLDGWTVSIGGGYDVRAATSSSPDAPDGYSIVYFQHEGGSISQTIPTQANSYYVLSLWGVAFDGTNVVGVSINGRLSAVLNFVNTVPVNTTSVPGQGQFNTTWENFTYVFQTGNTTLLQTTLKFTYNNQIIAVTGPNFLGPDIYYGTGGLDAISVTQVPEPSSVVLLGGGLVVGLIYYRRRQLNPPMIP